MTDGYVFDDEIELPFITDDRRPDPRYDGLIVIARSVDVDTWMEAEAIVDRELAITEENRAKIDRYTEIVAASLVRWNVTDKAGGPVPCDLAHLRSRPKVLRVAICQAWRRGQLEVEPDFGDGSASGSPVVPIPQEPLAS